MDDVMMGLQLYNTLTRKKEAFRPLRNGEASMYACGPTVYHYVHIGNLRTFIMEDVLRRTLEYGGYRVKHVMNITDVGHLTSDADEGEDKMQKGARREKKTAWEIARFYEDAFFKDAKKLNLLKPTIVCRATEHIKEMIDMIKALEQNGHTYVQGGNVYFDISTFPDYALLGRLSLDEHDHARVEEDGRKRHRQDFVLWFTRSKFESQAMKWDSPWGVGYPGWHIECSAMSTKHLGEEFDLHCGGIDLIPVHHTNEIAQARGATKKKRWVHHWVHGEFLNVDGDKMSKSDENVITLSALEQRGFNPLHYRFFVLQSDYRKPLLFNKQNMENAKHAYEKLKARIMEIKKEDRSTGKSIKPYQDSFLAAINDDLNTAKALAVINEAIKDDTLGSREKLDVLYDADRVLGLRIKDMREEEVHVPEEVLSLAREREKARVRKDWARSDELRDEIKKRGFAVADTKGGFEISKG